MIIIEIPGYKRLEIKHIVCDYNGTIAVDGKLIGGIRKIINDLIGLRYCLQKYNRCIWLFHRAKKTDCNFKKLNRNYTEMRSINSHPCHF
jgi:hypothetical protein